ncbi:GGDEF domain-containing protein [Viridibacterium curvum]|uniref:diguanylate cyclase n=1 Tax=Viridibacterium curvum TaxID=1101404 RepID=A0ABP9QRG2_9RHOO
MSHDNVTRLTSIKSLMGIPGEDCLVVIHSPTATELGRRYLLDKPTVGVGRGADNDIVILSDSVSRNHVRLERRGPDLFLQDLQSTNGTYANNEPQRINVRCLIPGDQIRIGDTVLKFLAGSDIEAQYHAAVNRMAITDGLTGLSNRMRLDTLLAEEVLRARRYNRALSVMMLDVDHFKRINDTHGHLIGDAVLRQIATALRQRLRPSDEIGRFGGEEFCAVLPETPLDKASLIAESLRELVQSQPFLVDETAIHLTVSIGISTLADNMQAEDLYRLADEALYRAKNAGRNRIAC